MHICRLASLTSALALAVSCTALHAGPIAPQSWIATIDRGKGVTSFQIEFDRPLDFATGDGLQFWLADSGNPVARAYQVIGGDRPLTSERLIEFRRAMQSGLADIVEYRTLDWPGAGGPNASLGGWGEITGSVPFRLFGNGIDFDVPFSLMGTPSDSLVYTFMITLNGASSNNFEGVSGVRFPPLVPEPASWALMVLGLLALSFSARRSVNGSGEDRRVAFVATSP